MKENVVIQPKDYASIVALMPKAYIDCGLGTIVATGDCTDILTETSRESTLNSLRLRSSKTDHSAAMGLTWVSPNGIYVPQPPTLLSGTPYLYLDLPNLAGLILIATDLFMGRSSEHEACKACIEALSQIPPEYGLMYDKGVSKLRVHLLNLNQVITPCYLRKSARFTIDQAVRNRGVTTCRYIVEVPFSNMKAWKFLGGIVSEEDKPLLNDVWWWTIGFHNFVHQVLKPPGGV